MELAAFQLHIAQRYGATDCARGASKTFVWFAEEFGELAHAIAKHDAGEPEQENLDEEFADCLAWLCTLANICNVDLERAVASKYLKDGGPKGTK
ncbi:MAG: nucleotide pyrophosphohydrolase [Phycisphaerales bacterium]|nr:nucleotide pyrophosphohydrolase [Phycisphaerales bacterium]